MIRSVRASRALLAATIVWISYLVVFTGFVAVSAVRLVTAAADGGAVQPPFGDDPALLLTVFAVNAVTTLLGFGLAAAYVIDALGRHSGLRDEERVVWPVLLVVTGPVAMPIYWWRYLRAEQLAARATTGGPTARQPRGDTRHT